MEREIDLLIKAWKDSRLGAGISDKEILELLDNCSYKIIQLNSGDLYAIGGENLHDLQIVISGEIRAEMVGASGKQILIDLLGPGRILAPALLFASDNILPVTLFANEESQIFRLNKEIFKEMMHQYPNLMENFINIVSDICAFLTKKIHQLSLRSLQGKIGDYLLRLSQESKSNQIIVESSWKNLADQFGVNRQSLARSLSQLENDNIIRTEGKQIEILQPHLLARLE